MRRAPDPLTADLFDIPVAPAPTGGSLDYTQELRHELTEGLKASPKTRYMIAAEMSELTGQEITKYQLDSWTAESRTPWRFPFEFAAAFEVACDTHRLQELLARKRGSQILVGEDSLLAELGRIRKQRDKLVRQEKAIRQYMRRKA